MRYILYFLVLFFFGLLAYFLVLGRLGSGSFEKGSTRINLVPIRLDCLEILVVNWLTGPLGAVPGTGTYANLAIVAERLVDSFPGYRRHDYKSPKLTKVSCASTPRLNTLNDSFIAVLKRLDAGFDTDGVPGAGIKESCDSSSRYGELWAAMSTAVARGLSPTIAASAAVVRNFAATLASLPLEEELLLQCRPGFAIVQYAHCFSGSNLTSSVSTAIAAANCLVLLAAGWSAIHPLTHGEWLHFTPSPSDFSRLFDIHLTHYINAVDLLGLRARTPIMFPLVLPLGKYHKEASRMEPIEPDGRNVIMHEANFNILRGYKLLPSFISWRRTNYRRAVYIDVGANKWSTSPKSIIDAYSPWVSFDEVILLEALHVVTVPANYANISSFNVRREFVEVGTGTAYDILERLGDWVTEEDFVVFKFDADEGNDSATIEWGFVFGLLNSGSFKLVDELFVEMHFYWPDIPYPWLFHGHSMWEQYDLLTQLRDAGHAVHAWP